MSSSLDEERLLKDVAKALVEARDTVAALRRGDPDAAYFPSPSLRWVTSRETLQAIAEQKGHPAGPALSAWVFALVLLRVNLPSFLEIARLRGEKMIRLHEPDAREVDLHTLSRLLVTGLPKVREDAVRSLAAVGPRLGDQVVEAADRAMEIARRAGLGHLDDVYSPVPRAELSEAAASFQRRTEDLCRSVLSRGEPLFFVLARAAGRDVVLPFPAHLGGRWLTTLFPGETGVLDVPGLSLGPVPEKLAVASFARLLARFGARYADAASACEVLPLFVSTPAELRRRTLGALFAGLFVNQPFLRRALGFNPTETARAMRTFALIFLANARLSAANVLAREALLSGNGEAARRSAADQTAQALYTEVPRGLALVLPRPRLTDPGTLLACFEGARLAQRLRERFDDDWFRNPRAHEQLRDELARPAPLLLEAGLAEEGATLLAKSLADLLG